MQQHVGTCSLCGGEVMGYRGAWYSVEPPPEDACSHCSAVRAENVIQMMQKPAYKPNVHYRYDTHVSPQEDNSAVAVTRSTRRRDARGAHR